MSQTRLAKSLALALLLMVLSSCVAVFALDAPLSSSACAPLKSVALSGTVLGSPAAPTAAACCAACTELAKCTAATYDSSGLCTLWSNVTGAKTSGTATSFLNGGGELPDAVAMQLFVSTFNCTDDSWTPSTPVCNWFGVTCFCTYYGVTCNATTERVILFSIPYMGCNGSVRLTQLPSGMQYLYLNDNQFSGAVDLTHLPSGMSQLELSGNQFSGTVDLTQLPSGMQYLDLYSNQFSGGLNLTQLPSGMTDLDLFDNLFCGDTASDIGCAPLSLPSSCNCSSSSLVTCPAC